MKLLALSYFAPPQLTPQSIQIARLLYHLDASVTLLHGRDARLPSNFDQYPDFFHRVAPLAVADPGPPLSGPWHRAALRACPLYGACPDQLGPWRRAACQAALAHVAANRPDALASFGMPMSDHLVALAVKRRTGLPWLAHFSDPWADNPFHDTTWLEHRVNLALERRVVSHADQLLFTSERTLELVMAKYPPAWRRRAAVLPHAWDLDHFAAPLMPRADSRAARHVVRFLGACYGTRSPQPLFGALARIAASSPRRLDGVAFELIGPIAPAMLSSPALRALPPGLLTRRPQLGYRAALQLARDAAALLVIDAPSEVDSVFLPSKLIDYIGVRRPVWGITPPGVCADLIAQWTGGPHTCADPAEPATVTAMLLGAIDALDCQPSCYGPERIALRFAPARIAHSLKRYLQHAIGQCARSTSAPSTSPGLRCKSQHVAGSPLATPLHHQQAHSGSSPAHSVSSPPAHSAPSPGAPRSGIPP